MVKHEVDSVSGGLDGCPGCDVVLGAGGGGAGAVEVLSTGGGGAGEVVVDPPPPPEQDVPMVEKKVTESVSVAKMVLVVS